MGLFIEGKDLHKYHSPEVVEKVKTGAKRLEATGAPYLIRALEPQLMRGSGRLSVLSAPNAEMRFHGLTVDIGIAIGGKASDSPEEVSPPTFITASYDLIKDEIIVCGESRKYEDWDESSIVNKIMQTAGYDLYNGATHSGPSLMYLDDQKN